MMKLLISKMVESHSPINLKIHLYIGILKKKSLSKNVSRVHGRHSNRCVYKLVYAKYLNELMINVLAVSYFVVCYQIKSRFGNHVKLLVGLCIKLNEFLTLFLIDIKTTIKQKIYSKNG